MSITIDSHHSNRGIAQAGIDLAPRIAIVCGAKDAIEVPNEEMASAACNQQTDRVLG